jgi:hypothetical protein
MERLGYLHAANELNRLGYPDLARELQKQAQTTE